MSSDFDLDAYLERIGYDGDRTPTQATLAGIVLAHAQTVSFENLDPLLGRPVRIDIAALQDKIVGAGRGGYCFEHNTVLQHALGALGFAVTGLAARVVMGQPPDKPLPKTHMLLGVDFDDGPVIADVGFGGQTPTAPLRLTPGVVQETPHEPFRLVEDGDEYRLEAMPAGVWTPLYRFGLQAHLGADYEMMNHYTATHPASTFVRRLTAARPVPGGRWALSNTSLARHRLGGETERRTLSSAAELRDALSDIFAITLPSDPGLGQTFDRIAAAEVIR